MDTAKYYLYIALLYIIDYLKSPRVIIFLLTVAFIITIKKILVEKVDEPISLKKRLNVKDTVMAIRYLGYSIRNAGKERQNYKDWKEEHAEHNKTC